MVTRDAIGSGVFVQCGLSDLVEIATEGME